MSKGASSTFAAVLGASVLLGFFGVDRASGRIAQTATAAPLLPGPMRQLLARGVGPSPVQTGLSFALTIVGGGRSIVAGPWSLRLPQASRPLKLFIEEARLESGFFEAVARLRNETGAFVGGLRLDFLEITEGVPDPGNPARATREAKSRPIALASPLFFGDLQPGNDAAISFRLEPIDLTAGSPYAVIRGVVTGAVQVGTVDVAESQDPVAVDSDATGRVYVGDGAGHAIFRLGPDPRSIRRLDAGCPVTGVAVRKKSGDVYASCRDVPALLRLTTGEKIGRTEPIGRALGPIRFGGKGSLYGAPGSVVRLDGLSVAEEITQAREQPFRAAGFDVGPDGTIWAVTPEPEGRLLRIRSARDVVSAAGPGEGLGGLANPLTCRVGPDGNVYVLETAAGERPPRVTVFDGAGSLARAWDLPKGRPADLAFASEGRLEIVWKRETAGSAVTVFRTF